jgi:MYXO-CTERM domain-containing protein
VAAWRRVWTRDAVLALVLLVPIATLAVSCGPAGAPPGSGVHAAGALAARVPSAGALRTLRARDVATPGTPSGASAWAFTLLAVALSSGARRRRSHVRFAAPLRTRAPPDPRFA